MLPRWSWQLLSVFILCLALSNAAPQRTRQRGGNTGATQTAQQQAAGVPQVESTARDGSRIVDMTATVNGLPLRFKVSGPESAFVSNNGQAGASIASTSNNGASAGATRANTASNGSTAPNASADAAVAANSTSAANVTIAESSNSTAVVANSTSAANATIAESTNSTIIANSTAAVTNFSAAATTNNAMGLNVLLHGDGGQSFFDFPNQNVQGNLMGVVVLAPDPNLFWGGGQGLDRTNGAEHSQAVADLITNVMPQVVNFDPNQVLFTGVSGGSLMLSGFFIPQQMQKFPNSGVLLNCGSLSPQVDFVDPNVLTTTTIHHQSTQRELASLQQSIPAAVAAYEQAARAAGLSDQQINQLQTVNNSPDGGHCAFDGQGFVSGVQLMANSYSNVIQQGGNGEVQGIGNVKTGVVGQQLTFGQPER